MDISQQALERAARVMAADFHLLDIQSASLDERWDLVHCGLVLEHLEDDLAALRNMRKMCGRYLIASTIAGNWSRFRPWEEHVGHVRNYAVGELENKLERAGFRVREHMYWGFPFYSPVQRCLQNLAPIGDRSGRSDYSLSARLLCRALYGLYHLNSSTRGDVVVVLAEPASP
jgi:SAM-dependent methyltransferase